MLETFAVFPDAVIFINEIHFVVAANSYAKKLFKCDDMIDLPANHFFPDWNEVAGHSKTAFATDMAYFDSSGICQTGEAVLFPLILAGECVVGVVFRDHSSKVQDIPLQF